MSNAWQPLNVGHVAETSIENSMKNAIQQFQYTSLFFQCTLAMIDTHAFKLNEYFVELNPANFNVLNRILN